jgi:DNA-binding transcriptional regulator YiaG
MKYAIQFHGAPYRLPARTRFSTGYKTALEASVEKVLSEAARERGCRIEDLDRASADPQKASRDREAHAVLRTAAFLHRLPSNLHGSFIIALENAGQAFLAKHQAEVERHSKAMAASPWEMIGITEEEWRESLESDRARPEEGAGSLDMSAKKDNSSGAMQQTLSSVLSAVDRMTAESRGAKSALAKALGVSRQRVTDWTSRKRVPNGEMALRLAAWVAEQEQQTKSPSRVSARKGQTTRSDQSTSHEKAKSNRPKG